ncbi:MAG: Rpn family recombination-promoting nuclease/putative transposase, partial [Acidobacteriota bacterium]
MADHDHGYKLLFSHAALVADVLRGFVREDWVAELDFETLERVDGSYVFDDLRHRESDMVWKVRWRDRVLYVYLLLEFQSTVDPFMPVRSMTAALFGMERSRSLEDLRRQVERLAGDDEVDEGFQRSVHAWLTRVVLPARFPDLQVPEVQDLKEMQSMLEENMARWGREAREEARQE